MNRHWREDVIGLHVHASQMGLEEVLALSVKAFKDDEVI